MENIPRELSSRAVLSGLAAAISVLLAASAASGTDADIAAGRQFAELNCARCHAIGREGISPFEQAPPFRTFASLWRLEGLEEALAEGIVVGHPDMPEFKLTPQQIENFIGYLESIQQR